MTFKVFRGIASNGQITQVAIEEDALADSDGPEDFFRFGVSDIEEEGTIQIVDNDNVVRSEFFCLDER